MFKILIVDDEAAISVSLRFLMERQGYQVETAINGQEALMKAVQFQPHLVLLDFMMPEINGLEVCQTLQSFNPRPKIVFLSAKGRTEDIQKGKLAGADAYLVKPFAIDDVIEEVKNLLAAVETP
jgi:two-component system, OmpR family, phosphate regulon response regulator PhoB